ncbi:hypothetical protein [Celeribacter halophilus]|uniref:hypothetical protein n=1 Tax=Celeribacter halophilus TaxID=576117 RepID=UPI003A8EB077
MGRSAWAERRTSEDVHAPNCGAQSHASQLFFHVLEHGNERLFGALKSRNIRLRNGYKNMIAKFSQVALFR